MKRIFLIILFIHFGVFAQTNSNHVWVNGYYRSNGTYVEGHYRTAPNSTVNDNFSTVGNTNPYTGEAGYLPRDGGAIRSNSYSSNSNYSNSGYSNSTSSTYPSERYPNNSTYTPSGYNNTNYTNTSNYEEVDNLKNKVKELEEEIAYWKLVNYYLKDSIIRTGGNIDYEAVSLAVNDSLYGYETDTVATDTFAILEEPIDSISDKSLNNYDSSNYKSDTTVSDGEGGFFLIIIIVIIILMMLFSGKR